MKPRSDIRLLTAIVDDDRTTVKVLLTADGGLAGRLIRKPKLYLDSEMFMQRCPDQGRHDSRSGLD
jgi:hypothetical protein